MFILIIKYLAIGYFIIAALLYLRDIRSVKKDYNDSIEELYDDLCEYMDFNDNIFYKNLSENGKLSYVNLLWVFEIIGCVIWPLSFIIAIKRLSKK